MGKQWKQWLTLFLGAPKSLQMVTAVMKLNGLLLGRKAMTNLDSMFKSITNRHYFANKVPSSQGYGFSSSHVWMWELDHKEGWVPKNWCFWTVVLEKTFESPLNSKKIQYFGHLMQRTDSLKRPWCWERLKAGGEGSNRGWDGWMASPTQRTWVWVGSGSWWWGGKPGVLQSMGLQRVKHDWVTELTDYGLLPACWKDSAMKYDEQIVSFSF